jgi:hypothetical protein
MLTILIRLLQPESSIKTLHSNEELQQEDESNEMSYTEQGVERESTQQDLNRKVEVPPKSPLPSGSKMKIESEHAFRKDQLVRSRLRRSSSSSSPKPYQLELNRELFSIK